MTVLDLILLAVSFLIVFSAAKKMRKEGLTLWEYAIDRGFGLWYLFWFKSVFLIVIGIYFYNRIDWSFLDYKIFK